MGFDIFVAETDKFHYQRNGCKDGSTFEFIKVVTILQGLNVSSTGTRRQHDIFDFKNGQHNFVAQ